MRRAKSRPVRDPRQGVASGLDGVAERVGGPIFGRPLPTSLKAMEEKGGLGCNKAEGLLGY